MYYVVDDLLVYLAAADVCVDVTSCSIINLVYIHAPAVCS